MENSGKKFQPSDRLLNQSEGLARTLILLNAGGAVATLSFLGAAWASSGNVKWALVPLSFFAIGALISCLFGVSLFVERAFNEVCDHKNIDKKEHIKKLSSAARLRLIHKAMVNLEERGTELFLISICAFALGLITGISFLAFA